MTEFNKLADNIKLIILYVFYSNREQFPMPNEEGDKFIKIRVTRRSTLVGHYPELVIEMKVATRANQLGKMFSTYLISAYEVNYDDQTDEVYHYVDVKPDRLESTIYAYLGPEGILDMPYITIDKD